MPLTKRSAELVMLVSGAMPLAWVIGVFFLAVRAKTYLGAWPQVNTPDPKLLPFDTHYNALFIGIYLVLGTLLIFPLSRFLVGKAGGENSRQTSMRLFIAGWTLVMVTTFAPGINFVAWFLD